MQPFGVAEAMDFMNTQMAEYKAARLVLADANRKQQDAELQCQVREDVVFFWIPHILKATRKGKSETHNYSFWWWSSCDKQYLLILQNTLGPKFKTERVFDVWGKAYTQVSW